MKAGNVMTPNQTVSPKAGASSASSKLKAMNRKVNYSSNVDSKMNDTFDSALDKAQNTRIEKNAEARSAESREPKSTSKDKPSDLDNGKNVEKDANAKKPNGVKEGKSNDTEKAADSDRKAAESDVVDNASDDVNKNKDVKGAKDNNSKEAKNSANNEKGDVADDAVSEKSATVLNAMLMTMAAGTSQAEEVSAGNVDFEIENQTSVNIADTGLDGTDAMSSASLEALIPQDVEKTAQAVQNQQLMDMLSGNSSTVTLTNFEAVNASDDLQPISNMTSQAVENVINDLTADEVSVNSPVDGGALDALALNDAGHLNPDALGKQNVGAARNAAQILEVADNQVVAMAANQTALSSSVKNIDNLSLKDESTVNTFRPKDDAASVNFMRGLNLTVENTISMPHADSNAGQNLSDMLQQEAQKGMADLSASTTQSDGDVLKQGNQLPENAAFDVVQATGQNAQPQVQDAGQLGNGFGFIQSMNNVAGAGREAQATAAQGGARDPYQVMEQIVEQARLIRSSESTEMVINLKPEHLGNLTLRIAVTAEGAVNASFHTDNPTVRGLIENSMVQLKNQLEANGIKVDNVNVSSDLSGDFFAQSNASGGGQQRFEQQQEARTREMLRRAFDDDNDALSVAPITDAATGEASAMPSAGNDDGVDYRV